MWLRLYRSSFFSLPFITLLLSSGALRGQTDIAGEWNGSIEIPGQALKVSLTLTHDEEWSGSYSIPIQGILEQPLEDVEILLPGIKFVLGGGVPGKPTFILTLSDDEKSLEGGFSQSGMTFPALFTRAGGVDVEQGNSSMSMEEMIGEVEKLLAKVREDWNIPGMAVAIVKDDSILLARGFGKRDLDEDLPVTSSTLFAIGSTTKAFTSLVVGTLVDEGKLDWDTPVSEYMPNFKIYDEYATTHLTVRDLLTHVSGLPRHDLMWYGAEFSRQELFDRLRYLEPTAEVRQKWQYQNLMFMVAGLLAERVTGMTWEELVEERIFKIIGMKNATLSVDEMQKRSDFSWPYTESEDTSKKIDFRNIDAIGPAGSINAGVDEMAQWLRLNLSGGEIDGKRVIQEETLSEIHAPQAIISNDPGVEGMMFNLYGMGWMINSYRGHQLLHHGGGIDGFVSHVAILPDDGIGIVVLTNQPTGLPQSAVLDIIDILLGLQPFDHIVSGLQQHEMTRAQLEQIKADEEAARVTGTSPTFPIGEYTGLYEHPGYGIIQIDVDEEKLMAIHHGDSTPMRHYHYDVFHAGGDEQSSGGTAVSFEHDPGGGISAFYVTLEPSLDPIRFVKLPPARLYDPDYLRRYTGEYGLAERTANISLHDSLLVLTVSGQPSYKLVPRKEVVDLFTEFELEELPGFRVRFQIKGDRVSEALVIQPNGTFVAEKR